MKKRIYQRKTTAACNRVSKKLVSLVLVAAIGGSGVGDGGLHFTTYAQSKFYRTTGDEIFRLEQELNGGWCGEEPTLDRKIEILSQLRNMRYSFPTMPQYPEDYPEFNYLDKTLWNLESRLESEVKLGMFMEKMQREHDEYLREQELKQSVNDAIFAAINNQPQVENQPQNGNDTLFDLGRFSGIQGATGSFDSYGLSSFMPETQDQYEDPLFDFWVFMPGPQGFVLPDKVNKDRGKK